MRSMLKFCVALFVSLGLASCHSDNTIDNDYNQTSGTHKSHRIFGETQPPAVCTPDTKKKFVYDVLHDSYLWADTTKIVDYEDNTTYPDDKTLLRDLRDEKDRFSFIMSKKAYNDFFEAGKNVGFGFQFVWRGDTDFVAAMQILLVYPGSPADKAGLKRSDQIIAIDGIDINTIYHDDALLQKYFEGDTNLTIQAVVKHTDSNTTETLRLEKKEFDVKTVIKDTILTIDQHKVGYLLFQSFVGTSQQELNDAFARFRQNDIDDLVLDIRYNGGGYVYIANHLASLIGGYKTAGKIFEKTLFNTKYSGYNDTTYFESPSANALSLGRVFVITTQNSCSASELVINALRASVTGIDVIQVGEHTCGKPYGMIGGPYCDKYLLPVQMKSVNADNVGDYVDGIIPKCSAEDDYWHDFGDIHEHSLQSVIFYMRNNRCESAKAVRSVKKKIGQPINSFRGRFGIY